jgi:flavin reductase
MTQHTPADSDAVRDSFVAAMSLIATGVTVVGAADGETRAAQTVSAMCSVSAEPPLLLVCVNKRSPLNQIIASSGRFCVSALATQHDHVADTFAGRPWPGKDRWDFTCGTWEDAGSGSPRLSDALASFDCDVWTVTEAGTHLVYLGAVKDVSMTGGDPLVYAGREYAVPNRVEPSSFPQYPDAHPANRFSPRMR